MTSWLTPKEAAAALRVSVAMLDRLVEQGRIPRPVRLGYRTRRWSAADFNHHLTKQNGEIEIDMILGLRPRIRKGTT